MSKVGAYDADADASLVAAAASFQLIDHTHSTDWLIYRPHAYWPAVLSWFSRNLSRCHSRCHRLSAWMRVSLFKDDFQITLRSHNITKLRFTVFQKCTKSLSSSNSASTVLAVFTIISFCYARQYNASRVLAII